MSTLEVKRQTQTGGTRSRTRRLLMLGALIAIGAAALILALTGADHATNTHPAIGTQVQPAYTRSGAVQSAAPAGYFRDPITHKLVRISTGAATLQPAPSSRPALRSVLRSLTTTERQYVLGIAALSRTQQAAAFGTDPRLSGLTGRQVKELDQLQSAARQLGLHPGVFGTASQR